ncbi:lipoprotein [Burkholderia pseudomallei]|uniref:hypothetical protein n=1 Tax=Burkholderia pseudomallei TaxID=28450 RepID=UPI00097549A7|nr:hypothetical protein [Burkholderia pseudomallei]ONE20294.1 hypothetical protein AQ946_26480 [Burkholderia pseudomallei]ONE30837.1 hypothetical protein AQ947_25995 [Burkholderia pseudomallei]ONE30847.1 hypothetical protein AQ948_26280 [Burkholderia pseudomallei]CAJ2944688.1 lipoprotein [Burkholderia pseudomallei]CAJ4095421.1 lipoprotein [Burkholderia pseudomallei]
MNLHRSIVVPLVFSATFLAGCGSSVDGRFTSGMVAMGAVAGSTVAAYPIGADGAIGAQPLAVTTSDASGAFSLPALDRWPALIRATHGAYVEKATGAAATLEGDGLEAVYASAPSTIVVSPYSSAVVATARAAGGLTQANIAAANATISAFVGDFDPQQTRPATMAAGAAAPAIEPGNQMALALGAESQSRTDAAADIATSIAAIVAQAAAGDTLDTCHAGAGDPRADGTLAAPVSSGCAITRGAARYAANARNTSGVTSLASLSAARTSRASPDQTAAATPDACADRAALLAQNLALFDGRRDDVQANLVGGVTRDNWRTVTTRSTWGPTAAFYGTLATPAACADADTFARELVIAAENYWIDQGINYCHHHIPGWTPPDDSAAAAPRYRNSSAGSTSGASSNGMTCTAQRSGTGAQIVPGTAPSAGFSASEIQWNGVDCSDFTSWIYNFVGLTGVRLPTAIGSQACAANEGADALPTPGVLLDIDSGNIDAMLPALKPGDLLYITQVDPLASCSDAGGYQLAHVVTWTGKRWSDLQAGPDAARYALARLGQPGSRLGGDLAKYLPLADLATQNPWMIIDSHYAGPAYRPFAGWYRRSLSNVRRIVGADAARRDPALAPYVIAPIASDARGDTLTLASPHANASAQQGWRMIYRQSGGTPSCVRAGIAQ